MTKKVPKSAAILTIKDVPNMSEKGKKDITDWLRWQVEMLIKEGNNYAKNFTARYLY